MSTSPTSAETTALLPESPRLEARDVEVLSDPDPATGTYRKTRTCGTAETLTSEALHQLAFPVAALFG